MTTILFGEEIFSVVSRPVMVDEVLVGASTVGEHLSDETARELKLLTRTQLVQSEKLSAVGQFVARRDP